MKRLLFTLLLILSLPSWVWAANMTIYMSAEGSATSPYDTWEKGATTCAQVQALTLDAGTHTINLRPGDSFAGYLDSDNWTAGGTISIKATDGDGKSLAVDGMPIILGGEGNTTRPTGSTIYGTHIIVGKAVNITIQDVQVQDQDYFAGSKVYAVRLSDTVNTTLTDNLLDGQLGTTIDSPTHSYNGALILTYTTGTVSISGTTIQYWGPPCLWATPEIPAGGTAYESVDASGIALVGIKNAAASVTISGNTIANVNGDGVVEENCAVPITITNNLIKNAGENAVDIKGTANNHVYANWFYRDATFTGMGGYPVASNVRKNGLVQFLYKDPDQAQNNLIEENYLGPTDTSAFSYKGNISNNTVRYNSIIDAKTGNYFYGPTEASTGASVGNASYSNRYIGTDGNFVYSEGYRGEFTFENETFYSDEDMGVGLYLLWFDGTFRNCAFRMNDSDSEMMNLDANSAPTFAYNIWSNANAGDDNVIVWAGHTTRTEATQAGWNGEAIAGTDIFGDPGLDANGYATGAASAVVNAGTDPTYALSGLASTSVWTYGSVDVDLVPRADNGGADIGAGEYQEEEPPPGPGSDSIAYDTQSSSYSAWGTSLTWAHTVAVETNPLLVVYVATKGGGGDVTGVTYNGDALTCLSQESSVAGHKGRMCYLAGPDTGAAYNIVASVTPTSTIAGSAISLYGVAQTGPEVNSGNDDAAVTTISTVLTTLTDNAWVVTGASLGANVSIAPTQGETERIEQGGTGSSGVMAAISTEAIASAGENTFGYGTSEGNWVITSASFIGYGGDVTAPTVTAIGVWDGDSCEQNVTDAWVAETVTICMELSEDVIVNDSSVAWTMTVGPTSETLTGSYLRKALDVATTVLLMDFTLVSPMRITHPQMGTASGGVVEDGSGNAIDFTGSAGDLDGTGTISISIAYPSTSPVTAGTFTDDESNTYQGKYATVAAWVAAEGNPVPDDFILLGTLSESINTPSAGTSGHPVTWRGTSITDKAEITGNWIIDENYNVLKWIILYGDLSVTATLGIELGEGFKAVGQ